MRRLPPVFPILRAFFLFLVAAVTCTNEYPNASSSSRHHNNTRRLLFTRLAYGTGLSVSLGSSTGLQYRAPTPRGCIITATVTGASGGDGFWSDGGNPAVITDVTFYANAATTLTVFAATKGTTAARFGVSNNRGGCGSGGGASAIDSAAGVVAVAAGGGGSAGGYSHAKNGGDAGLPGSNCGRGQSSGCSGAGFCGTEIAAGAGGSLFPGLCTPSCCNAGAEVGGAAVGSDGGDGAPSSCASWTAGGVGYGNGGRCCDATSTYYALGGGGGGGIFGSGGGAANSAPSTDVPGGGVGRALVR